MNLGELYLELGLDTAGYYSQLDAARQEAIRVGAAIESSLKRGGFNNLNLNPKVNHANLTALNKHLESKRLHVQKIQREWDRSPLAPKVDLRQLDALEQKLNRIQGRNVRVSVDAAGSAATAGNTRVDRDADAMGDRIAKKLEKAVSRGFKGKNPILGMFQSLGGAALDLTIGSLFRGAFEGIGREVSRDFGKGISTGLKRELSYTIGSFEFIGREIGAELVKGIMNSLGSDADTLERAIKDIFGNANIAREGAAARGGISRQGAVTQRQAEQQSAKESAFVKANLPQLRDRAMASQGKRMQFDQNMAQLQQQVDAYTKQLGIENLRKQAENLSKELDAATQQLANLQEQENPDQDASQSLRTKVTRIASEYRNTNQRIREVEEAAVKRFQSSIDAAKAAKDRIANEERSLKRMIEAPERMDLIQVSGDATQNKTVRGLNNKESSAYKNVSTFYRDILENVLQASGIQSINPSQIPKLVAKNMPKGATGAYMPESNTIAVSPQVLEAINQGKVTQKQMETLVHELRHAVQYDFGKKSAGDKLSLDLITPTAQEKRQFGRRIENSVEGRGAQVPEEFARQTEADAYTFASRNAPQIYGTLQRSQSLRQMESRIGVGGGRLEERLYKAQSKVIESMSKTVQSMAVNLDNEVKEAVSELESIQSEFGAKLDQISSIELLPVEDIESFVKDVEQSFTDAMQDMLDIAKQFSAIAKGKPDQVRQQLKEILPTIGKKDLIGIGQSLGIENAQQMKKRDLINQIAGTDDLRAAQSKVFEITRAKAQRDLARQQQMQAMAQGVGGAARGAINITQTVVSSPQFQMFSKGTQQAAGAMLQVAKTGYAVAQGFESVALDLVPMGRTLKAIGQQTAVPAALAIGATALLPGGGAMAAGATNLVGGALAPFAQSATASLAGGAASALSGLPQLMGIQAAVTSAVTGAIEMGMSGAVAAITPAIAAVLGGKAIQTAASLPLKGIQAASQPTIKGLPPAKEELRRLAANPEPLQMPLRLPSSEKVEVMAIEPIKQGGLQKKAVNLPKQEQQARQQAQQVAQKAGEVAASVFDATQKTFKSANDAVQQADRIARSFRSAYKSLQDAIKSGDATKAQVLLDIIKENAVRAQADIKTLANDLGDQAKFGTEAGNKLNNRKSQISKAVKQAESQVKKMKPADIANVNAIDVDAWASEMSDDVQFAFEDIKDKLKEMIAAMTSGMNNIDAESIAQKAVTNFGVSEAKYGKAEEQIRQRFDRSQQGLAEATANTEDPRESILDRVKRIFDSSGIADSTIGKLSEFKGVAGLAVQALLGFSAASFIVPLLQNIGGAALDAAKEFENLDRIFTFAYGSMSAGADAMAKVRSEAKSLGLDLRSALQGQAQLAAATRGTNMEGFTTESLASATRQATAVMGLDPQQAERVQLAIQQMASKGKISSEELRQQLGESLPGAFQIAARAIGVTTSELSNMLDRGEVLSEDFLPKFAAQLSAESQAGLAGAANTAQASINRFNNSVLELQASLGAPLLPVQKLGLNALAEALNVVKAIMPVVTVAVGALGVAIVQTTVSMISGTAVAGVFAAGLTALKSVLSATIALMSTPQFAIVVAIAAAAAAFMKFKEVYLDVGQQQRDFADQTIKGMQGYKNSIIEARMELEKLGKIAPSDLNNLNPENNRRSFESRLKEAQSKPFFEKTAEDLNTELTGAIQNAQRDRQSASNQQAIQAGIGLGNAETSPRETLLTLLGSYRGVAGFTGGTNQDSTIGQLLAQQKQLEGLQIQRRSLLPGESGRRTALDREIQSIQESMAPLQQVVAGAQSQAQSQIQFFEQQRKLNQDQGNTAEADKFAAARDEVQTLFEELSKYIQPVIDRLGDLNRDLADVQGGFEKLNMEIDRQTNSQKRSVAQGRIAGGLTPGEIQAASAQVDIASLNSRIANNQSSIAQRNSRLQNDAYLQELLNPILQRYGATSYEQLTPSQINEQAASMTGEGQQNDRQLLERFSSEFERTTQMQQETDQLLTQVAEARAAAIEQIRSTTNQIYEFFRGIENQSKELELSTKRTANQAKTTLAQNKLKSALIGFQDSFLNEFVDSLVQMVEALNKPLDEALNAQQQILQAQQQYFSSIQQAYSLNQQLPTEMQAAGLMGNGGIMPGMQSGMPGQAGMMPGAMPGQAGTGGLVAGTTDNTSSFMGVNVANPQPITSAGVIANQTAGFSPLALLSEQDLQSVRQQLLQQGLIQPTQGGMQAGAMPDGLPGLSVPLDDPRAYQRQQEGLRSLDPVQSVQAGNMGIQQAAGQAYQNYQQQVQSIQTQLNAAQDSAQLEARASLDRADRALFDAGRRMSETGRNFQRSIEDLASQGQQQTPFVQLQTQLRGLNNQFEDSMRGMEDFRRGLQQTIDQSGMLRDFITEGLAAGTLPEQFRDMLPGLDAAAAQAQQQLEGLRQMQDEYNQAFLQAAKKAQADFDRQQKQSQAQIQANIRQMDNDLAQARSQQSQLMGNNDRSRVFDAQSKGAALGEEYYQQIQNLEQLRYEGKLGAEQFEEMVGKLRELNDIKLDNLQQEIQNLADSGLIDALSKIPVGDSNAGQMNSSDRRQQQAQVNRTRQQAQRAFDEGYISRDQLDRTLSAASAVGGALNNTNASVFTFADVARQNQGNPLVRQLLGSIGQGDALALADLASPQSVQASMAAAEQANQAGIAAGDQYAGISSPVTNAVNQLGDRISGQLASIEQALRGVSLRPNLSVTSKDPVGDAGKIYADVASKAANL